MDPGSRRMPYFHVSPDDRKDPDNDGIGDREGMGGIMTEKKDGDPEMFQGTMTFGEPFSSMTDWYLSLDATNRLINIDLKMLQFEKKTDGKLETRTSMESRIGLSLDEARLLRSRLEEAIKNLEGVTKPEGETHDQK